MQHCHNQIPLVAVLRTWRQVNDNDEATFASNVPSKKSQKVLSRGRLTVVKLRSERGVSPHGQLAPGSGA